MLMKTLLFTLLVLTSQLSAITLDSLVASALQKAPSLEVIMAKIEANKQSIDVANQFNNPELLITTNTLDSSQAMSQTIFTLKQKIQYYDKRDTKQQVALADEAILQEQLHLAQAMLVQRIKTEVYGLWELEALKKITQDYVVLTKQNIDLYESYTSVSSNQHMGIMKAELSLSNLKIELSQLNAQIAAVYARLSYLASQKVSYVDITLTIGVKPDLLKLQKGLDNSIEVAIKEKELLKQNAKIVVADSNNYPDVNLLVGYSYRENFDNYFNVGVGLSLPIYGTEDAAEEEQRALGLGFVSQKEDTLIAVDATLQEYYAQMLSAFDIYHIVQDDALKQLEHMQELSNASISTGADLFQYIDVLFLKLALEKKSINAISNYNKAQAKISQLSGALQ